MHTFLGHVNGGEKMFVFLAAQIMRVCSGGSRDHHMHTPAIHNSQHKARARTSNYTLYKCMIII